MLEAPPLWRLVWWGLWALQALWCWYNVNQALRRVRRQGLRDPGDERTYEPPAVVIVPIKGADDRLADHFAALTNQGYAAYRVIFAVESESDPAHARLTALIGARGEGASEGGGRCRIELCVAGPAAAMGQKVHNQLAALERIRPDDAAVVFADADAVPDAGWLKRMVLPLRKGSIGATTGYRWFVPTDDGVASRVGAVINAGVACLLGPDRRNFAWGGSMAISRAALDEAKLADHWRGALSDDYQLTRAVARTGRRLYFIARCLVPSPVAFTWASLLRFGRRQYVITRVHAPFIWFIALLSTSLYTGGLLLALGAAAVQARGWPWGLVALAIVVVADRGRAWRRRVMVHELFDEAVARRLEPAFRLERWGTALVMALHLLVVLSSAAGRTIDWAGVTYRLRGRQSIDIVHRAE